MIPSWDEYFMNMATLVASRSKDPNTHVGCVIAGPDHGVRSTGYNSFPRGIRDDVPERLERPEKYLWIEHSERNAIYNAARSGTPLDGCTLYGSAFPCMDCARAIIQAGIVEVVISAADKALWSANHKWTHQQDSAAIMLAEAGVRVREV